MARPVSGTIEADLVWTYASPECPSLCECNELFDTDADPEYECCEEAT